MKQKIRANYFKECRFYIEIEEKMKKLEGNLGSKSKTKKE